MAADVFKILKDLEYKAVGVKPDTQDMSTGFFVSFRPIGLPIPTQDYQNPWSPTGSDLQSILSSEMKPGTSPPAPQDPASVKPIAGSNQLTQSELDQLTLAGVGASEQAYVNTFALTDDKLAMSNDYLVLPGTGKISDAWWAITRGANIIDTSKDLSAEIKQDIATATAVLMTPVGDPTPHHNAYTDYESKYKDAVKKRDNKYADAMSDPTALQMWPIQGKDYQDDIDEAMQNWESFGFKNEIEQALAVLSAQGTDPALLFINRARNTYQNSLVQPDPKVPETPYTFMLPNDWYSSDSDGWNHYTQDDFHSETHVETTSSHMDGSGSVNYGFFSIGGSGSSETSQKSLNLQTNNLSIEFHYTIVDIKRPWLDTSLLNLSNWFLVGDYSKNCISDGTYGQQLKGTELTFLPSIVTSLLLVSNLKMHFEVTQEHRDTLDQASSGGGSVGYGPFNIFSGSGNHSTTSHDDNLTYNLTSQGLSVDGVQLIGYVSTILPASPKQDSKPYMASAPAAPAATA
ncbi:hypothetical protein [Hymenobacter norwichensis]|uniref:hypothetical protein n=1 Tax=Hymenobacter norwichensis TaxID=223903 RepID=UPI0003B6147B|nr:hypothetical protein [Hymenobacter norwichensis]